MVANFFKSQNFHCLQYFFIIRSTRIIINRTKIFMVE